MQPLPADAAEESKPAPSPEPWRARAFGLELEGRFPAPLLPLARGGRGSRITQLRMSPTLGDDLRWGETEVERVGCIRDNAGNEAMVIDRNPGTGYRVSAAGFGTYLVSEDAMQIWCAPARMAPWEWQRLLVAQVLPLAAALQGHEVLHASGVEVGGRGFVFVGEPGTGKTTLALNLLLDGAGFLADDVIALDLGDQGAVRAHPGAAMTCIRLNERALIDAADGAIGVRLGESDKAYREVTPIPEAVPLAALYQLIGNSDATAPTIRRVWPPDPSVLLAGTFLPTLKTPPRLEAQLHIHATLAQTVPVFEVTAPPGAEALAAVLAEHTAAVAAHGADR